MSKKSRKHPAKPFRAWLSIGGEPLSAIKENTSVTTNDDRLEDIPAEQSDDGADEQPKAPPKGRGDAATAVMGAAFDAATTPAVRLRLANGQALAVILHVPNPSWVKPATKYFARVFGERWVPVARDGTQRGVHKAELGSDEIASNLLKGRCVVGIAADVSILPQALVIHGDITVRLSPPDGAVLRAAITRFTGRNPGPLADGHAPGLDLPAILAAFRPGTGAKRIADRLAAASAVAKGDAVGENLPKLADAVEYGSAREWGLGLARDIVDYRAGRIGWSDLPRGLVLAGEPGTGKSLFSGMLAEACGLPLVRTSVSDWFTRDSYLHNTIQAVQAVFDQAASMAPAIMFLDECDALPNRATVGERNKDYWKPLINFVLLKLDNAISSTREGVIVIAATNDASDLDPALVRPGRLEKIVRIERPDLAGTLHILQHHVRGDLPDRDLAELAIMAERSTGAELMLVVREGRRIARHAGRPLAIADLSTALMPAGSSPARAVWRTAVHEAGHAIGALAIPFGDLRRCVVGHRGDSAGHTLIEETEDDLPTLENVRNRVTMLLCGRAAERVVLSAGSLGDQSDLAAATREIATVHGAAGLGETIAYLGSGDRLQDLLGTDRSLRRRVERDLRELGARAEAIVRRHRGVIVAVALELSGKRHLSGDAIRAIFARTPADAGLGLNEEDTAC